VQAGKLRLLPGTGIVSGAKIKFLKKNLGSCGRLPLSLSFFANWRSRVA